MNSNTLQLWVIVWAITGGLVTPFIFHRKGRDPRAGGLLGALLGAVGGIILLGPLWLSVRHRNKKCPRCAEIVRAKALVCTHCGYEFSPSAATTFAPVKVSSYPQEARVDGQKPILMEVKNLKKYFPIQKGLLRTTVGHVKAVDGVSFFVREGETLGLVGESGCGKTTTGRLILRAIEPTEGEVWFRHGAANQMIDIASIPRREMKALRREMQIIFQDPYSSLNPRMTVTDIISEPLVIHGIAKGAELKAQVRELLEAVGLKAQHMNRYPYAFSGGQRQRLGIARALALRPKLIVCDEPVSALDVSVQAQVLNLLEDLQKEFGLTYLFIAHDLSVVEHISDRVAVMYLGVIVELAPATRLYEHPLHPYTEALLSAVPADDPDRVSQRILLEGDVPSPANPPSGCKFHTRCRFAVEQCRTEPPAWRELEGDHWVACHLADELTLKGI